jgi:hypothetical protein
MKENDESRDRRPDDGEHVGERLDAYRTGELDAEARQRVEAHLEACGRCRQELAALGAWAAAIERGYEARRTDAAALAPDWAAQRSAIVARTSGRARAPERSGVFRWGPQIALVAVAALIVGIVWRENPREQPTLTQTAETRPAGEESRKESDADRRGTPSVEAVEGEDALGRDEARSRRADAPAPTDEPAAAAPPADRIAQENAPELEKQAGREQAEDLLERREALADRVAEPSPAAPFEDSLADVERFERDARAALEARDTTAARRALSLWSDTLLPRGALGGQRISLADSLREFLERAE